MYCSAFWLDAPICIWFGNRLAITESVWWLLGDPNVDIVWWLTICRTWTKTWMKVERSVAHLNQRNIHKIEHANIRVSHEIISDKYSNYRRDWQIHRFAHMTPIRCWLSQHHAEEKFELCATFITQMHKFPYPIVIFNFTHAESFGIGPIEI